MRRYFSKSFACFFLIYFISIQILTVYACGMSIKSDSNGNWDYGEDSAENSFINYDDGIEKLILTRKFEQSESGIAWVIPIPADPNKIEIDVLENTPRLHGMDIVDSARNRVASIGVAITLTQLWTLPFGFMYTLLTSFVGASPSTGTTYGSAPGMSIGSIQKPRDVEVYQTLSKGGITSQVITARTSKGVYEYLQAKGLQVPDGSLAILDGYIGDNFSFVTSWIEPSTKLNVNEDYKGVFITFPTDQIFYPLHPGSVYKGPGLPETIYVMGYVTPKLYQNIKHKTNVKYFEDKETSAFPTKGFPNFLSTIPREFYISPNEISIPYTKITVNAQPSLLTEDLYIAQTTPLRVSFAQNIVGDSVTMGIFIILVVSAASGVVAGAFTYGKSGLGSKAPIYALVGIGNIMTILGTVLLARKYLKTQIWKFILTFSIVFLLIDALAVGLIQAILY